MLQASTTKTFVRNSHRGGFIVTLMKLGALKWFRIGKTRVQCPVRQCSDFVNSTKPVFFIDLLPVVA